MTRGLRVSAIVLCVLSFTMARTASAGVGSSTDPGSPQNSTQADGAFNRGFSAYGPGYSVHHTTQTSNTKSSLAPRSTAHVTGAPNSNGDHHCYGRDFDWGHDKVDLRDIKFDDRGHGGDDRDRNIDDHDHKFDDHKFDDHDRKFDDHKFDACRAASR